MSYEQHVKEILFDIIIIIIENSSWAGPVDWFNCMRFHSYLGVQSKGYGMLIHA